MADKTVSADGFSDGGDPVSPSDGDREPDRDADPRRWRAAYAGVLAFLAVEILLLALLTRFYR